MNPQKRFKPYIGLSFVHLVLAMVIMVVYIDAPSPWRGILFAVLLLSLMVWPVRFLVNFWKE